MPLKQKSVLRHSVALIISGLKGKHLASIATMALVSGALEASSAADTAETTWTGGTNTGWSTATNWTGSVVPSATTSAVFNSSFTGANQPTLTAAATTQGVWVASGVGKDVTIGGAQVLTIAGTSTLNGLANTGILLDDSGNHNLTIGDSITTSNSTTFLDANTGTMTLNGTTLSIGAGHTLTLDASNSAGAIVINSTSITTGTLAVNTTGKVILSGANSSLSGLAIQVNNGTLQIGSSTGTGYVGSAPTSTTIGSSGTLGYYSVSTFTGAIADNGTITSVGFGGTATLSGVISGTGNFVQDSSPDTANAATDVTKLTGLNTYTGTTTIKSGALNTQYVDTATTITAASAGSNVITVASAANLAVGDVMYANAFFGSPETITGISGTTITLSGTANTSYSGTAQAVAFDGGPTSLGQGSTAASTLVLNGGTLAYNSNATPGDSDRLFTLGANGGTIDTSGAGSLWMTNTGALAYSTPNVTDTLTLSGSKAVGARAAASQINGNVLSYSLLATQLVDNGSGALTLVKNGVGTWVVAGGNNTYTGGTIVNAGTLQLQSAGSLGTGSLTVASGATVALNFGGNTGATAYSTGAAEFSDGDFNNFISTYASSFAAGSTLAIDPSDVAGSSTAVSTGTTTVTMGLFGGADIDLNNANFGRVSNTGNVSNVSDIVINNNLNLGTGGFIMQIASGPSGYETTELAGNNTFTGTITLNGNGNSSSFPTLIAGSSTAFGNASGAGAAAISVVTTSGLAVDVNALGTGEYVVNAPILFNPSALGSGTLTLGLGVNANNTQNFDFTGLNTGTSVVGSNPLTGIANVSLTVNGGTGMVIFGGNLYINNGLGGNTPENFILNPYGSGDVMDVTGNIADSPTAGSGTGYLILGNSSGTGTMTLTGSNTYTGNTQIRNGTVQVNNLNNVGSASSSLGAPTTALAGTIASGGILSYIGTGGTSDRVYTMAFNQGAGLDDSGTGTLVLTGGVTSLPSTTATARTLTLSGSTSGVGEITGAISDAVAAGTVNYATISTVPNSGGNVIYIANAAGLLSVGGTVTGAGIAAGTTITSINGSQVVLSGNVTAGTYVPGETVTVSGTVNAPTAVSKTGTGEWILTAANTYTGTTTLTTGILNIQNGGALGSTTAGTSVGNGASLQLQGGITVGAEALSIYGAGATGATGALESVSGNNTYGGAISMANSATMAVDTGTLTLSNTTGIAGAAGATLTLTGAGTGILDAGYVDGASAALIKKGTGTWVLAGTGSYTGATTINDGILRLGANNGVGTAGTLTINETSATGTATFDLNGFNQTLGGLTLGGATTVDGMQVINSNTSTASTLTMAAGSTITYTSTNNPLGGIVSVNTLDLSGGTEIIAVGDSSTTTSDLTISSVIQNGAVSKSGSGTLVFSGANTYAGTTAITNGILNIQNSTALGTTAGGTTISNGATLQLQGGISVGAEALSLTGAGAAASTGALENVSGSNTYAGQITLGGNSTISSDAGNLNLSYTGAMFGTSTYGITFTGAGNGTLAAAFNGGANATTAGGGAITKTGTGTWTLSGADTYTGATSVNQGVLALNGNSLAGTTVQVASGAAPSATSGNATLLIQGNVTIGNGAAGTVTIKGGNGTTTTQGTLSLVDGSINKLTLSNTGTSTSVLNFSGSTGNPSVLNMEVGATSDEIVISAGKLFVAGPVTVNIAGIAGLSGTQQTLISAGANSGTAFTVGATGFTLGTTSGNFGGRTVSLASDSSTAGKNLYLVESAVASAGPIAYWTGDVSALPGGTTAWNSFENGNTNTSNFSTDAGGTTNDGGLIDATTDVVFNANANVVAGSSVNTTLGQDIAVHSLTFNTSSAVGIGGANTLTIAGNAGNGITANSGAGADTISSNVALGSNQTWTNNSANALTVSGSVSGAYALTVAGSGKTFLSNAVGNTYTGGTIVSAGTLYANNGGGASYTAPTTSANRTITATNSSGSATGTAGVTVNSGGTLAGSGTIASTSNGVKINSGGTLASGGVQTGTTAGAGLTINNAAGLSNALFVNGGATLTFDLGSSTAFSNGSNAGSGALNFANPNTNSTYLSLTGTTVDQIFANSTATTNINLVDLTSTVAPGGVSLTLRSQNPYLLIQTDLGNNADFANLMTSGGLGQNGYVLGVSNGQGGYTAFTLSAYDINGNLISSSSNLQNLQLYLFNGDLEVVPEPGTWALMIGGLALLIIIQRRRQNNG